MNKVIRISKLAYNYRSVEETDLYDSSWERFLILGGNEWSVCP